MLERKLRIMMLAPTPFFTECGSQVRIYEGAKALVRRGHSVRVVSYHLGGTLPDIQIDRIPAVSWIKELSTAPSWYRFYLDTVLLRRALKLSQTFKPHLIHAHHHQGAWIGGQLKKQLKIPLLFDCRGSMTQEMIDNGFITNGSLLHRLFSWHERRINAGASDCIVTSAAPMARNLVEQWGVSQSRVKTLTDGVDTTLFRPYQRDDVRARLRLPPDVPLVAYIGTLNHNQGIETLLTAIVQLKSQGSPIRFLMIGYPEEQYRIRAADLGIERMLIFTGKIDYTKTPVYLSAADLAISPKTIRTESNSKLLTYMACGLPTVAFDTAVNRELMGDAGIYATYNDASDLADQLVKLMANREERARLGQLARERAEQRQTWDIHGARLDEIYRKDLRI